MTVTPITDHTKSARIANSTGGTYEIVRTAAVGDLTDHTLVIGQFVPGATYGVVRLGLIFDTSVIPAGAVISAARLRLYCTADATATDFDMVVQNGQPTYSHDPIVLADYDMTHYAGNGGSFNTAGLVGAAYNDIILNAAGRSWINGGGSTKLCVRSSDDIGDIAPGVSSFAIMGNPTTVGQEPILEVTWTPPVPGAGPALKFPLKQTPVNMVPLG